MKFMSPSDNLFDAAPKFYMNAATPDTAAPAAPDPNEMHVAWYEQVRN